MISQLVIFRAFFFFLFLNSKTSKVNQQSVLNIELFHNFPE